ncbi:hypothetical protein [Rhodopseudomonas sp. P2A-2r]|uniref:hypothetical protein n=1 Tax=unclassified Rhodopseudomonas TaxID=2638247 RepID=UPI0022349168|nr:hypothetical protein [Rhodopseudomonas sp. P2A-2r]UZE49118.1 hypothetical protein ONR75_31200 [Rhodopseudomonas sp. P2A-2r]
MAVSTDAMAVKDDMGKDYTARVGTAGNATPVRAVAGMSAAKAAAGNPTTAVAVMVAAADGGGCSTAASCGSCCSS